MTDPLVSVERLDRVHLYVSDRPAAIEWYRRVPGLRLFGKSPEDDLAPDHPVFLAATDTHHCVSLFEGVRPEGGDRTVAFLARGPQFLGFAAALPDDGVRARDGTPLIPARHNDYGEAITYDFLHPAGNHLELVTYDTDKVRAGLADLVS